MKIQTLFSLAIAANLLACAAESGSETGEQNNQENTTQSGENNGDNNDNNDNNAAQPNEEPAAQFQADLERGAPLGDASEVALADVIADPAAYKGSSFITQGTISQNCTKQGCWMELRPSENRAGGRIITRFKDYGFFVPLDSRGDDVRMEAIVVQRGARNFELEASGVQIRFAENKQK